MLAEPTASALLHAVQRFLMEEAGPHLPAREAFLARVAGNALGVVIRELEQGEQAAAVEQEELAAILGRDGNAPALRADLCAALRSGAIDADAPGLLASLERIASARVRIDQPTYASLSRTSA